MRKNTWFHGPILTNRLSAPRISASFAALLLIASVGDAGTVIDATRAITNISVQRDHAVLYFAPALSSAPEGCTGVNSSIAVTIDLSESGGDRALFTAALAAFHAGSNVGFLVKGCGADGIPQAIQINVQP